MLAGHLESDGESAGAGGEKGAILCDSERERQRNDARDETIRSSAWPAGSRGRLDEHELILSRWGCPARRLHQDRLRARVYAALEHTTRSRRSESGAIPRPRRPRLPRHAARSAPRGRRRGLTKPARSCSSAAPRSTRPTSAATFARAAMNRHSTVELLLRWEANAARVGRDGKTADEWCAHVGHAHWRRGSRRRRPRRGCAPPGRSSWTSSSGGCASAPARWSSRRRPSSTRRASEDGVPQTKGEQA